MNHKTSIAIGTTFEKDQVEKIPLFPAFGNRATMNRDEVQPI